MKPIPLRLLYISYASAFLGAALIYFALNGVDLLGRNPKALYFVNVLSIVLTLTGCYVAVSFDRFGFIKRRLHSDNPDVRRHAARLVPFGRIVFSSPSHSASLSFREPTPPNPLNHDHQDRRLLHLLRTRRPVPG